MRTAHGDWNRIASMPGVEEHKVGLVDDLLQERNNSALVCSKRKPMENLTFVSTYDHRIIDHQPESFA